MGPGAIVGVLGTGVPRLACLRPAVWLKGWPSTAHLHQHEFKTLARGQASRADDKELPQARPHQAGSRGGGEIKAGYFARCPMTQAMTTKGASRAPDRAVSSFPLWCKGASAGESIKQRHPFRCNKTKTSRTTGWKSSWSPSRRHHQILWQVRTDFSQDKCTRCSPSKWPVVGALPCSIFGKRPGAFAYK